MLLRLCERHRNVCQTARFTCQPLLYCVLNRNVFTAVCVVGFQLAATLPEDIRPGPDFHGLPWEPVIVTALVGMATLAIVFWRTCLSVSVPRAREPADTSGTVVCGTKLFWHWGCQSSRFFHVEC